MVIFGGLPGMYRDADFLEALMVISRGISHYVKRGFRSVTSGGGKISIPNPWDGKIRP